MQVLTFLLKRFGWMIITVWIVFTVSFFLMRQIPGGPLNGERVLSEAVRARLEARYNLDAPISEQYFTHLWNTVRLDFGPSFKLQDYTVNEILAQGFPVSAALGILGMVFAITIGMTSGVVSAVRRNSAYDYSFMMMATLGIAIPNFVLAAMLIVIFVFNLQMFPAAGWGDLNQIILPAFCLGAPFAGYIARLTRTGMLEVLGNDYIRTAYAKGLSPRTVVMKHGLRGALLPVVSYLGPAIAGILTGSLVLERIFVIPGMGSHFIEAAIQRDYTLAMGALLTYTVLLFGMNTLVDLAYSIIDPRVKLE
ncbi:MAG: ABC transporter [Planctomycetaceae bacterium]|jgi:oligopeptide transport system permease protein|nr:ABC transporter [Planctomycetaceae bacterium]MBK95425.1 ABC transporter [Planctomycetaceae bacterium]|tara:strand:- start:3096 stop:4019 length:924 start_codon:yes stop_codon:yes gene_type:complete